MLIRNRRLYNYILKLHLYVGVALGLVISLICITGSAIVYKPELEKLSIKSLTTVSPQNEQVSLQLLLDNVLEVYPDFKVNNLVLYGDETSAYNFRGSLSGKKGRVQIYVDQHTGKVLGADYYSSKLMQWLYDFHVYLLMGKTGLKIVAILGFALIFIAITGLFLLPTKNLFKWQRKSSSKVKNFRIHILVGLFSFVFLLIISLTGSYYGFKKEYQSVSQILFSGKALAPAPTVDKYDEPYVSLDSVLKNASQVFRDGTPTMIFFPKDNQAVFSVRLRTNDDYERTGSNHIYIHPTTGQVVKTNLWKEKPSAEKVIRSMYFLHFGTFAGHWSRVLWVILGLVTPILYFTGMYLWIRKLLKNNKTK